MTLYLLVTLHAQGHRAYEIALKTGTSIFLVPEDNSRDKIHICKPQFSMQEFQQRMIFQTKPERQARTAQDNSKSKACKSINSSPPRRKMGNGHSCSVLGVGQRGLHRTELKLGSCIHLLDVWM